MDGIGGQAGSGVARVGGEQPRLLTFQADTISIDLEVVGSERARRIIGQVLPAQAMDVEVRTGGGVLTVRADAFGRFVAEGLAGGPLSLRCRPEGADRPQVVTEWITVPDRAPSLTAGHLWG